MAQAKPKPTVPVEPWANQGWTKFGSHPANIAQQLMISGQRSSKQGQFKTSLQKRWPQKLSSLKWQRNKGLAQVVWTLAAWTPPPRQHPPRLPTPVPSQGRHQRQRQPRRPCRGPAPTLRADASPDTVANATSSAKADARLDTKVDRHRPRPDSDAGAHSESDARHDATPTPTPTRMPVGVHKVTTMALTFTGCRHESLP